MATCLHVNKSIKVYANLTACGSIYAWSILVHHGISSPTFWVFLTRIWKTKVLIRPNWAKIDAVSGRSGCMHHSKTQNVLPYRHRMLMVETMMLCAKSVGIWMRLVCALACIKTDIHVYSCRCKYSSTLVCVHVGRERERKHQTDALYILYIYIYIYNQTDTFIYVRLWSGQFTWEKLVK